MKKVEALKLLSEKVCQCVKCPELVANRTQTVFDSGNPHSKILMLAESPGKDEDLKGEVLVGKAGRLLNNIIKACGWERDKDLYLCNIIKCRPPNNRTPTPVEADNCSQFLKLQIRIVSPKVIICLGAIAAHNLLKTDIPISQLRGIWKEYNGISVMPTFHPSFCLRNPESKQLVWFDMKQVIEKIK